MLETGQEVWLDAWNIKTKAPSKKFKQKHLGPFTIMKQISPVTYQLQLPAHINIHPVFHVDLLMPYKVTAEYSIPFKCLAPGTISGPMDLGLQPLPPPPPNPKPSHKTPPPDKPPETDIAFTPFEKIPNQAPENPYRAPISAEKSKALQKSLGEALQTYCAPFEYKLKKHPEFNGEAIGCNFSEKDFGLAISMVIEALESGYAHAKNQAVLNPADWASLACAIKAAIGLGYHDSNDPEQEEALEKLRAEALDTKPLSQHYPSLFHHLTTTAEHFEAYANSDIKPFCSWFMDLKADFCDKANKAAEIEVEEDCHLWKANEINRHAAAMGTEITKAAKKKIYLFFCAAAANLNLHTTYHPPKDAPVTVEAPVAPPPLHT